MKRVGNVLGRFHPRGDQAACDALVRMAQASAASAVRVAAACGWPMR